MGYQNKPANQVNPCSRVLGEIARLCFLIGEETDYDAHLSWSAHVNQLSVHVTPKGARHDHAVLSIDEYMNIPKTTGIFTDDFRTDTYAKVKDFAKKLAAFYENRAA